MKISFSQPAKIQLFLRVVSRLMFSNIFQNFVLHGESGGASNSV